LYDKLGLPENSSIDVVKQAYFELAKKYHPDQTKNPLDHEKFLEIKQAYELLRNPETKASYDASMKTYRAGTDELENILRRMREQQNRGSGSKDYSSSTNQAYKEWAENQKKYYNMKKDFPQARASKQQNRFFWSMAVTFCLTFLIIFIINREKAKNKPRRRGATPYPIHSVRIPHYFRRDLLKKQIAYQQFRYVEDYISKSGDPNELPNPESAAQTKTSSDLTAAPLIEAAKPEEMYIATISHIGNAPKQYKKITRIDENGNEITELIQTTKSVAATTAVPA
jgi:curved DNA-binding protein CbpA